MKLPLINSKEKIADGPNILGSSKDKWEVLIDGKLIEYHSCSQSDLETAKRENKNLKYIGSGEKRFLNGERYPSTLYYHFFVHTSSHIEPDLDIDDYEDDWTDF